MWALVYTMIVMGDLEETYMGSYDTAAECQKAAEEYYVEMEQENRKQVIYFDCVRVGDVV